MKTRLILVNNPITSLFMASWLQQNDHQKNDWQNIGIYSDIMQDDSYSLDSASKNIVYERACKKVLNKYISKWIDCRPKNYDEYQFKFRRIKEVLQQRKKRKTELISIRNLCTKENIFEVNEIWSSNAKYKSHFAFIFPKAKNVLFDHGHTEVKNMVLKGKEHDRVGRLKFLPRKLRTCIRTLFFETYHFIEKQMLFFAKSKTKVDKYISLLAEEINSTNPIHSAESFNSYQPMLDAGKEIAVEEIDKNDLEKLSNNNTAVILLENIKDCSTTQQDTLDYLSAFEKYLMYKCENIFSKYKIDTIIFKPHFFHEEYVKEAYGNSKLLSQKYQVLFLNDHSPTNYKMEYYLPILQPKLLLGSFSTGLLFCKKIYPTVATYTFDLWIINYCIKKFGIIDHYDSTWIRKFYYNEFKNNFTNILPTTIDNDIDYEKLLSVNNCRSF